MYTFFYDYLFWVVIGVTTFLVYGTWRREKVSSEVCTPPFAFSSVELEHDLKPWEERITLPNGQPAIRSYGCSHPETVKVEDILGNHVANWCANCETTIYMKDY